MKIVTSLETLFKYARELGEAKKHGDAAKIAEAEKRHEEYRKLCLESDEMITGYRHGDLY